MSTRHKHYSELTPSGVDWLGDVPKHWDVSRLGKYFDERREKVSDKDFEPLSVTMQGIVPRLETAAKTDAGDNRKKVCVGDFVINSRSDRKGSSGVSPLNGSVSLISIVLTPRKMEGAYIHHLLRSQPFQEEFYRYGKGIVADLWSTNSSEMKNILLPIPTLPEQRAIAAFLDRETGKIDRMIGKQERMIELLKEKRQAVISHAVTKGIPEDGSRKTTVRMKDSGIEWLGEIPAHWEVSSLKFYWYVIDCKHLTADFVDDGIPLASIKEVQSWTVDLSSAKQTTEHYYRLLIEGGRKPEAGDIIYSRNATVGEAALVTADHPKFSMGQDVCILKPQNDCSSEYYMHLLKSPVITSQLNELIVGATFKRINVENIRNFIAIHPPEFEQEAIAKYLDEATAKIDHLIAKAEQAIELMKERRTALISAAVTGKIDVRGAVVLEGAEIAYQGAIMSEPYQAEQPALMAAEQTADYKPRKT